MFTLYRIFYGDNIVYVGRTNQPLQNRIRGHLFQKHMHRTISIDLVSKIEYTVLDTEADRNLYEIYYILKYHPALNVDDKTRDNLTVELPELEWKLFETKLWEKWRQEIHEKNGTFQQLCVRYRQIPEEIRIIKSSWHMGEITEDECYFKIDALQKEKEKIKNQIG